MSSKYGSFDTFNLTLLSLDTLYGTHPGEYILFDTFSAHCRVLVKLNSVRRIYIKNVNNTNLNDEI